MSTDVKYVSHINPGRAGGFDWSIRGLGGILKSGTDRTLAAAQNNSQEAMAVICQTPVKTRAKKRV